MISKPTLVFEQAGCMQGRVPSLFKYPRHGHALCSLTSFAMPLWYSSRPTYMATQPVPIHTLNDYIQTYLCLLTRRSTYVPLRGADILRLTFSYKVPCFRVFYHLLVQIVNFRNLLHIFYVKCSK